MQKITLLILMFCSISFAQTTVDFEAGGAGASWTWIVDQNGANPALEILSNPNTTGANSSATAAKFTATTGGQPWALTYSDNIGSFTFTENNSIVKMMVLKTVATSVAIKFEDSNNQSFYKQIEVTNTVTNGDWEELTFDFSTGIGDTYNRMVIIPDFLARSVDHVVFFDQITFNSGGIVDNYNLEDIDFETPGFGSGWVWTTDNNGTDPVLEIVPNPNTTGANSTATTAKFTSLVGGDPWALTFTDNVGSFTFTADNSIVTIMVLKTVATDVGLKFEGPDPNGGAGVIYKELKVPNTVTNGDWEQLTFDFSSEIGKTYDRMVVIPDFLARNQDHINYFDQISFGNGPLGLNDMMVNSLKMFPNPANDVLSFSGLSNDRLDIAIHNILGKQVLQKSNVQRDVNIASLSPGLYLVTMTQGQNVNTKKLLVN